MSHNGPYMTSSKRSRSRSGDSDSRHRPRPRTSRFDSVQRSSIPAPSGTVPFVIPQRAALSNHDFTVSERATVSISPSYLSEQQTLGAFSAHPVAGQAVPGWTESLAVRRQSPTSCPESNNLRPGPWFEIHRNFVLYVLDTVRSYDGPSNEIAKLSKQWAKWDALTSLANYHTVVKILFGYLKDCSNLRRALAMNEVSIQLSRDISCVFRQMEFLLSDRATYKDFLSCRGTVAQRLLDLLQDLLDSSESVRCRPLLSKALVRLSRECELHPTCFTLPGVKKVGQQVAGGGFGDIWKGLVGGQNVAVKSMRVFRDDDVKASLKKLGREALIWRQLSHPNLLPFFGLYVLDDRPSLISPWMDNGDLNHFLNKTPGVDRVSLIADVAMGLEYLHSEHIVHGDLKAANILVTPSSRACIADFGLSSIVDELSLKLTFSGQSGRVGGTVRYQAPELLSNKSPNHFGSDVYALACVGYEILTGKVPFYEVPNEGAVIFEVIQGGRPSRLEGIAQEDLWALLDDCWHQQAEKRPTIAAILRRPPIEAKIKQSPADWDETYSARFRRSIQEWPLRLSIADIERKTSYNAAKTALEILPCLRRVDDGCQAETIVGQPTLDYIRKTWWDSLLSLYLSPNSRQLNSLSFSQRSLAMESISSNLRFLFRCSNYWFSFLHIPTFFSNFYDPSKRDLVQPSLILAALALSIFWQSSEVGMGQCGRERALKFREEAQSALEASLNAGWVDDTLAQAAWLLAMFEISANPKHTSERLSSAMATLDSIIRSLSLTLVDLSEPSTSSFSPGKVSAVADEPMHMRYGPQSHNYPYLSTFYSSTLPVSTDPGCSCNSLTLKEQCPEALEHTPLWAQTPALDPSWSEADIKKESIRRLCWSSIVLAAEHSSYSSANGMRSVDLFIADPSNYALLFSGEAMVHSSSVIHPPSPKDTIWALYDRAFLLWHACIKMRNDTSAPVTDKGQFAIKAWLEADAIEEALNRHTCGIERAFIFRGREYIFNTRMCITYEFQCFVPLVSANVNGLFHRQKAEEWLSHQATVMQRFISGLHTVTGNSSSNLSRRPFFVFGFMGQVSRGLTLWECDNSLTTALDMCKTLLAPLDYLTALWPCPEQHYQYDSLRERLREACQLAGIPLPPPLNLTLPSSTPDEFV